MRSYKAFLRFGCSLASLLALAACGHSDNPQPSVSDWSVERITGRSVGGKEIPTATVIDCRKKTSDGQATFYYSVIANTRDAKVSDNSDYKITDFPDAEFFITMYSGNTDWLYDGSVSLKLIQKKYSTYTAPGQFEVTANGASVDSISSYNFFSDLKVGDRFMLIDRTGSHRLIKSGINLPGASKGTILECQPGTIDEEK